MTERLYQLTLLVRRDLRSWDFSVPVDLECKFPTICGRGPSCSHDLGGAGAVSSVADDEGMSRKRPSVHRTPYK